MDDPILILIRLPGRFRWNRWLAFVDGDVPGGPIGMGRTQQKARDEALFLWRHGITHR